MSLRVPSWQFFLLIVRLKFLFIVIIIIIIIIFMSSVVDIPRAKN